MKPSDYIGVLQSKIKVDKEIASSLEEIIEEYPYFQSARAVYLKYLHDEGSFKYNAYLKSTAAFTLDRTVLFDYITSDRFKGIDDIKPIWIEQPKEEKQEVVFNVAEELPIVGQITPEVITILVQPEAEEVVEEVVPVYVVNVAEEFPITSQITPDVITISVQPEVEEVIEEAVPVYVVNVAEEFPITSQITPDVITISVQPEAEEVVEEAVPVYVVNVAEELPIVGQITPDVITISVQPEEEKVIEEVVPVYVVNVAEEFPITSQITPEVITISVQPEAEEVVEEEVPVYVVDVKQELPIVHQVTTAVLTVKIKPVEINSPQKERVKEPKVQESVVEESIEERLEIGKPIEFSRDEKHSFQEWLQLTAMKPIDRSTTEPALKEVEVVEQSVDAQESVSESEEQKVSKQELIDRFIEANPRMPRANATEIKEPVQEDINVERPSNNTTLMTETLAKVYLEQKKYDRAIQAYEILILKNPEKKSLFADRIADIKKLKKNNT